MKINYFNFKKFEDNILMTNDFGKYIFVSLDEFKKIIRNDLVPGSLITEKLISRKFVYEDTRLEYSSQLMHELRRVKSHVNIATSLHIFVVTTACNMGCVYCQANNGSNSIPMYMTKEIAEKAVDIAIQSPEPYLTFEFQGGEPLLNFEIIQHIVEYAELHKEKHEISYSIVSNLTLLTDEIINFLSNYNFGISTSLDGSAIIHNTNRPFRNGNDTFDSVVSAIKKLRNAGLKVGAIQTTTRKALQYPEEIIDTYIELGFDSVFIRPLTPMGKAIPNWGEIGYTPEDYLDFYKRIIDKLIKVNKEGYFIKEEHTAILLNKIMGNFVNYMELRSPCGAAVGQIAYYADGNIFTCDEGRMLYEMGDTSFCLGNVCDGEFSEIMKNNVCKTVCAASILESIPSCCDCVYQPYCGTCPVVNYAKENDIIAKMPRGYRCKIYSGMLDYIFKNILQNDEGKMKILWSWSN